MKKIIRRISVIPEALANSDLHPLLKRIYAARQVNSQDEVLYGLNKLLHFSLLKNIDLATKCLMESLLSGQRTLIIGDFDADGATSTALMILALRAFGFNNVGFLIPNRFEFGYGLTPEIVEVAAKSKPDLIVTVDNGISSHDGVLEANRLGIKVLITDHHLPAQDLPDAAAILNPNQPGDEFTSKTLAGVGVVFYLMLALRSKLKETGYFQKNNIQEPNLANFLDLVALGTVADLVPLDYNNRILVAQGLIRIARGECRPGIKALINISKRNYENITAADLAYAIAPRLNAAGRLDDMSLGVLGLITDDLNKATLIAKSLDELNSTRREIEVGMQSEAFNALAHLELSKELPPGVCILNSSWHIGVIGILASRVKERVNRPVIAFAPLNDDELKVSGRSIEGLHLRDVLSNISATYPELIKKFGGHAMAVGLSLKTENYEKFNLAFIEEVEKHVKNLDLRAQIYSDGELELENISLGTAKLLQRSGPWGQRFPEPVFDGVFKVLDQRLVGDKHLKLLVSGISERNATLNAIAFNVDKKRWPNPRCNKVYLVYRLNLNEYNDNQYLQLVVENFWEV